MKEPLAIANLRDLGHPKMFALDGSRLPSADFSATADHGLLIFMCGDDKPAIHGSEKKWLVKEVDALADEYSRSTCTGFRCLDRTRTLDGFFQRGKGPITVAAVWTSQTARPCIIAVGGDKEV